MNKIFKLKKTFSIMVCLFLLTCAVFPAMVFATPGTLSGQCGSNLRWYYEPASSTLHITGTGDMKNYSYKKRPSWEAAIDSISGDDDIYYNIQTVVIDNGVTSIGDEAFMECTVEKINIPYGVKRIGDEAFWASSLNKISIPASVASIGASAFGCCGGLEAINVSADNKKYSSKAGVLYNKKKTTLIQYPGGKENATFTMPSSVKVILGGAFSASEGLCGGASCSKIVCSKNLSNVHSGAFDYYWGKIYFPGKKPPKFGKYAFYEAYMRAYYKKAYKKNWKSRLKKYGADSLKWAAY